MVCCVSSSTASSSRTPKDARMTRHPAHRICSPTIHANSGSSQGNPNQTAAAIPIMTLADDITSVRRWIPSATNACDLSARPCRINTVLQIALMIPAAMFRPTPMSRFCQSLGVKKASTAFQDQYCGQNNQHTLYHGADNLSFVVAIVMVFVRRHCSHTNGPQCRRSGGDIYNTFECFGQKCHRPSHTIGHGFQAQNDKSN